MMKYTKLLIVTYILAVLGFAAQAQLTDAEKSDLSAVNMLKNGGFENKRTGWTNSGGAWAHVAGSGAMFGQGHMTFTPSGSGQYVQTELKTIPAGLQGQACEASMWYNGGSTSLKIVVLDGTAATIATRTLEAAATAPKQFGVPFACPASGTLRFRIESTGASALIAVDRVHLGGQEMLPYVDAVPTLVTRYTVAGSNTHTMAASTRWARVTVVGGGGGGDCSGSTACAGNATAGGQSVFGTSLITVAGGGAATGNTGNGSAGGGGGTVTINAPAVTILSRPGSNGEGGNATGAQYRSGAAGGGTCLGPGAAGVFTGHGAQAVANTGGGGSGGGSNNNAIGMGGGGGGGGCAIAVLKDVGGVGYAYTVGAAGNQSSAGTNGQNGGAGQAGIVIVEEFGYSSGMAVKAETIGWKVDANLSGGSPQLGTGAQTSYTEIGNASLTLTQNTGSISVGVPCNSTNASTVGQTTCPTGTESVGVTFNAPAAGDVEACVEGAIRFNSTSNGGVTFQVVETASNATAILQEGKSRQNFFSNGSAINQGFKICGTFTFATAGQKTIRLFYEQTAHTASPDLPADADANVGQRDIHWTVRPLTQNVPAPVLVGPYAAMPAAVKTGNYTMVASDDIIDVDSTSGAVTITLPAATGQRGRIVAVSKVNTGSNAVIIQRAGSETIGNGLTSTRLYDKGDNVRFYSDGSNWQWLSDPWRTEWFGVSPVNGSSCTLDNQKGNAVSGTTPDSAGDCSANWRTGVFSAEPFCTAATNVNDGTISNAYATKIRTQSTSGVRVTNAVTVAGTTTGNPNRVNVVCAGPR